MFRNKGAARWAITRAEKLQLSVFLPNDLSLDDWYAGVYVLPTVWPDVSMLGADNLRKVAGYDFHLLRKKYDVQSMWGNLDPQWRLLKNQLETKGPGWYSLPEREERLFTNRSNRPGDDMKDELRSDGDPVAWQAWRTTQNQLWQLRQPDPPVEFPGEQGIFIDMYTQVREEEQVISPQFTRNQEDVDERRGSKLKKVPWRGSQYSMGLHAEVLPSCTSVVELGVATCFCIGMHCAVYHSFIPGSWSAWIASVQALLLFLDDVPMGSTIMARRLSKLLCYCFGYSYDELLDYIDADCKV